MTGDFARGCRHGRRPAQSGEGGLAAQPVRVSTGGDKQLGGCIGTDTVGGPQGRIDLCDKDIQLCGEVVLLMLEEFDAAGQRLGGRQHCDGGGVAVGGGPASGQCLDQRADAVAAIAFTQLGRSGDQQRMDLVGGGGVCLNRAAARGQHRPQRGGLCVFGHGKAVAGQGGASGGVSIQRVGLALAAPCRPIGAANLGHLDPRSLQRPGQARAVTAGAFHPGDHDAAKASGPSDRIVIAGRARRKFGICHELAGIGNDSQMIGVQMSVDADDDAP